MNTKKNYKYFLIALIISIVLLLGLKANYILTSNLCEHFNIQENFKASIVTPGLSISLAIILLSIELYIISKIYKYIKNNKKN